jgi:apolipoprotein N-acyltransferase
VAGRVITLGAALVAGVLLCASFPPLDWWWAAVAAFALLGWVLTRPATALAGGLGYGFVFGLAFYMPLLPWTSDFVGVRPWLMLAASCAVYPALFGLLAVVVRRSPGWPIWFAALWAVQEWAKSVFSRWFLSTAATGPPAHRISARRQGRRDWVGRRHRAGSSRTVRAPGCAE